MKVRRSRFRNRPARLGSKKVEKSVASIVLPCLKKRSNQQGKEARYIEIFKSDHDRGGFGQCFEFGRVRSKERDDVDQHNGEFHARILEITWRLSVWDGFNQEGQVVFDLAFSFSNGNALRVEEFGVWTPSTNRLNIAADDAAPFHFAQF